MQTLCIQISNLIPYILDKFSIENNTLYINMMFYINLYYTSIIHYLYYNYENTNLYIAYITNIYIIKYYIYYIHIS